MSRTPGSIPTKYKHPDEIISFFVDFTNQLEGRTIDGVTATVVPSGDLVVDTTSFIGAIARVQVSGGTASQMYNVEVQFSFSDDTDEPIEEFNIHVLDR